MPGFSTGKLSQAIGGQLCFGTLPPLGGPHEPAGSIVAEVERVQEKDIFWALPGQQQFAEQAFIRGASGVVVCQRHVEPWAGKFAIHVSDSYQALEQLARWSREQFRGKLIWLAGAVDTSSTRHAIETLLAAWFVGSIGAGPATDHITSLLRLAQLSSMGDFEIIEGCPTKRFGEADLISLSRPDIVVLNSAASRTQASFFPEEPPARWITESLAGTNALVVNGDDQPLGRALGRLNRPIIKVGRSSDCDFNATDISYRNQQLSFAIEGTRVATRVSGRHQLGSVLTAYAVARIMGLAPKEIAQAASKLTALPGRCSVAVLPKLTLIDDTHHATEDSLRDSLGLLSETRTNGRRILVCGEIAVDATSACRVHRLLANAAVTRFRCDRLVACGTYAKDMQDAARDAGLPADEALAFDNIDDAMAANASWTAAGDLVLVAGHRLSGMQAVVQSLVQHATNEGAQNRICRPHRGRSHNTFEVQPLVSNLREFDATLPPG